MAPLFSCPGEPLDDPGTLDLDMISRFAGSQVCRMSIAIGSWSGGVYGVCVNSVNAGFANVSPLSLNPLCVTEVWIVWPGAKNCAIKAGLGGIP